MKDLLLGMLDGIVRSLLKSGEVTHDEVREQIERTMTASSDELMKRELGENS